MTLEGTNTTATTETATANGEATTQATAPETLLTGKDVGQDGPAGEGEGTKPQDGYTSGEQGSEQGDEQKPEQKVPDSPEGYELTFDEGVQVDKALLGNFQTTAHKLGLNTGQAQELASLYAGHVAETEKAQNLSINFLLVKPKSCVHGI